MRKRAIVAALMVVGASLIWTTAALAAQTEMTVRIEGKEKTLFEGPIMTEGHTIQAASDAQPRQCDATNNSAHAEPMATPTAASVDAMEMTGQTFDANWFEGFDDYYVTQFGPDHEDLNAAQYWGILVNGVFTAVGGCQYGDRAGDEALWVYDAFSGRRLLWLAAESDPTVAPRTPLPTAYVEVGQPLRLLVDSYEGGGDEPQRTGGITVAPVETDPVNGDETVDIGSPEAVSSNSEGSAEITFTTTGWHRIKAQKEAGYIRSNRLDVCVEPEGGGDCGPLPADAQLRVPGRYTEKEPESPAEEQTKKPAEETTQKQAEPTTERKDTAAAAPTVPASNEISLGSAIINSRTGVVRLNVGVAAKGTLALSGPQVVETSRETPGPGLSVLTIKPTSSGRKVLREKGKLKISVQVAFTPIGGATATRQRSLTLRLVPPKK